MAFKVLLFATCLVGTLAVDHSYQRSNLGLPQSNSISHLQRKSFDSNINIDYNQFQGNHFGHKNQNGNPVRTLSSLELQEDDKEEPNHDEIIPHYTFSYSVHDEKTGDIKEQKETRHGDHVKGYYSMKEADGRRRLVEYQADDKQGFNAVVTHEGEAKIEPKAPPKEAEEVLKTAAESSHKPVYVLNVEKPQRQYQVKEAPKLSLADIITLFEAQESRKIGETYQPLPRLLLSEENLEEPETVPRFIAQPRSDERRAQILARSQVRFSDVNSRYAY